MNLLATVSIVCATQLIDASPGPMPPAPPRTPAPNLELPPEARRRVESAFLELLVDGHHAGGAVYLRASGVAATSAHALGSAESRREVVDAGGQRWSATVLAIDPGMDLALLQVEGVAEVEHLELRAAPLAPTERIQLLGTPLYRPALWLPGQVAGVEGVYEWYPQMGHFVEIRHVAATCAPGTSGGPWVDDEGRLVGIQSGAMARGSALQGVAFLAEARGLVAMLDPGNGIEGHGTSTTSGSASVPGVTPRATLGAAFEELWQHGSDVNGRYPTGSAGLVVRGIQAGGPLSEAGLEDLDLIVAAEGRPVLRVADLLGRVRTAAPGTSLRLTVLSQGENGEPGGPRDLEVTTGALTSTAVRRDMARPKRPGGSRR